MAKDNIFNDSKKTGSIVEGFMAVFNSLSIMTGHKGFLKFFVIPFLLNIVILSTIFYFSFTGLSDSIMSLVSGDAWYMSVLRFLLKPLLFVIIGSLRRCPSRLDRQRALTGRSAIHACWR